MKTKILVVLLAFLLVTTNYAKINSSKLKNYQRRAQIKSQKQIKTEKNLLNKKSEAKPLSKSSFIEIPLIKNENTEHDKKKVFQFVTAYQSYISNKETKKIQNFLGTDSLIKSKTSSKSKSSTSMVKEIPLSNFKNTQYTGKISLSRQSNAFDVIFDTGSANFWINSVQCSDEGCLNHKQYDSSDSSNFKRLGFSLDVQFGTGSLSGEINEDTVFLGGVQVDSQDFAEITEELGDVFVASKFDGIVGLAFPEMSAYNLNPVFDNIMSQKRLDSNIFSFYFNRNAGQQGSKLFLGGYDESLIQGQIKYHDVIDPYYWTMRADNILINGEDVGLCPRGCKVIADTGTSLITGPSSDLTDLLMQIQVDEYCNNIKDLPTITFVLDGTEYSLYPNDYLMQITADGDEKPYAVTGGQQCAGSFMPLDIPEPQGPAWILGDIFLSKYFTIYDRDNQRVGFARSKM